MVKKNHHPQGRANAYKICREAESENWTNPGQKFEAIHHHLSDLALVNIEQDRRSQVISGAVQGTDRFSNVFCDGSYIQIPLEI